MPIPSQQAATREIQHRSLDCGLEFLYEPMPGYHTATLMLRVPGGLVSEPEPQLGLAYVLEQTVDKGTDKHDARALANAFDAIGANCSVHTGLESWVLVISALPEFIGEAIALLGELVGGAIFPDDITNTTVALAKQELIALEDSAQAVLRRAMSRQAYGPLLGRHRLGNNETLSAISPDSVRNHWQQALNRGQRTAAIAGNFDVDAVTNALESAFGRLPQNEKPIEAPRCEFVDARTHVDKDLEQTQIGISFPGVAYSAPDYYAEKAIIEILSGGMGARLFTEVREKQGLVYWVSAWHEHPRNVGMIHVGAATTPERCHRTLDTLLREVARLEEDVTEEELQRAKVGMLAEKTTSGASVHQRAGQLLSDQFQLGKAIPPDERIASIKAITVDSIKSYLRNHPREALSIVTIGPKPVEEGA